MMNEQKIAIQNFQTNSHPVTVYFILDMTETCALLSGHRMIKEGLQKRHDWNACTLLEVHCDVTSILKVG